MKTDSPLATLLPRLMDLLRHELRQYGEILALLDQQQEFVMARSANDVLQSVADINDQMARIQEARGNREECQREAAASFEIEEDASFENLLPRLPETYRPALGALVQQNNELLGRVQQRARQNHLLLSHSVELMQRFVNSLAPATAPTTYNGNGRLSAHLRSLESTYQATG